VSAGESGPASSRVVPASPGVWGWRFLTRSGSSCPGRLEEVHTSALAGVRSSPRHPGRRGEAAGDWRNGSRSLHVRRGRAGAGRPTIAASCVQGVPPSEVAGGRALRAGRHLVTMAAGAHERGVRQALTVGCAHLTRYRRASSGPRDGQDGDRFAVRQTRAAVLDGKVDQGGCPRPRGAVLASCGGDDRCGDRALAAWPQLRRLRRGTRATRNGRLGTAFRSSETAFAVLARRGPERSRRDTGVCGSRCPRSRFRCYRQVVEESTRLARLPTSGRPSREWSSFAYSPAGSPRSGSLTAARPWLLAARARP